MQTTTFKTRIREAAVSLFAEKGYQATSIRDVANVADVSLAMVNYHFKSKEQLYLVILDRLSAKISKAYSISEPQADCKPQEQVLVFYKISCEFLVQYELDAKMIIQEMLPENTEAIKETIRSIRHDHQQKFSRILSGSNLRDSQISMLYHLLFGTLLNLWQAGQIIGCKSVQSDFACLPKLSMNEIISTASEVISHVVT